MACAAALLVLLAAAGAACADDILYNITEEEFHEMPQLFALDEWTGCLATRGVFCVGTFDLTPAEDGAVAAARPATGHRLFDRMRRYSANWVDNFNHTQLHRGLCLSQTCGAYAPAPPDGSGAAALEAWFTRCVNATTVSTYALSARLSHLDYCERGTGSSRVPTSLTGSQRAFAAVVAALLALAALSTALDATMHDHTKKGMQWALCWSLRGSWRALQAPAPAAAPGEPQTDLRALDGLRVLCMMCVIIEHVCWLATQAYVSNVWEFEQVRRMPDAMLMANSTLVVQIFFLMSSFLLAHKLLTARRRAAGNKSSPIAVFGETMLNRVFRVAPSYFVVVWFAASWWARLGAGPLWKPLVAAESAICRKKWWTQLLFLNNIIYADEKCLIQTWYLAADMQLYAASLALTLALARLRRGALAVLAALLAAAVLLPAGLAYAWHLVPTFAMHRPELVRRVYSGESSFNVLYQSPLSNAAGALAGLLLAHGHHALRDSGVRLGEYRWFRWASIAGPFLGVLWAMQSPALLGAGPPSRAGAAALAAIERPLFSFFVAVGLLGAMHDVKSPLRTFLSWRGWAAPARLSFGVLLLHMPFNKALVANRLQAAQIDRQVAFVESFGVALVSYICALPLALLVEYPAMRALRLLRSPRRAPAAAPPRAPQESPVPEKADL